MGGGCNDAQPGKAPLSAAEVGGSFVLQYYRTLTTDRDNLHKYYKDESICSRGMEGASPDQITYTAGVEEIREEIRSSGFGASRTEVNCIQSQESKQGGIVVLVLGYFEYSDSPQKVHFTQVFFLDKQTDPYPGYFVLNDILRYVSGKSEQSELQAQPQTDLPPPLLPPPQPPMLPAPKGAAAVPEPCAVVEETMKEAPMEEPAEEEDEYREMDQDEGGDEEEENEDDEPIPDDNLAEDAAVAEALAAADAAEAASPIVIPEEKPSPPSWASMAGKLKEGGGQLGNSKLQGFALPAPAKAKAGASLPAAKFNAASSTMPVLPPPSAAAKAKAKAAVAAAVADDAGEVRLWLSRIPETVENQEVLECLNKLIGDAGMQGHVEIDRKDSTKEWGYVNVPSQDVADMLVQQSKDRKVQVRGKPLKIAAEQKQNFPSSNRRGHNNTGGKGAGEDGGEKAADGNRRPRGKGAKGGGEAGSKGGKGGADSRRGGEKGSGGNWRAQA